MTTRRFRANVIVEFEFSHGTTELVLHKSNGTTECLGQCSVQPDGSVYIVGWRAHGIDVSPVVD